MKRTVYYLDDDRQNVEVFSLIFGDSFDVQSFVDAKKFLEASTNKTIEVLLVDFRMPQMSGLEVIKAIKTRYPNSFCFLITGHIEDEITSSPLVDAFVRKPYDIERLFALIHESFMIYDERAKL